MSDLTKLRDPAFLEALTQHIAQQHTEAGGPFGEGVRAGLRAAIFALPGALDDLVPGLLPRPYSEGCGCSPGEVCAPPADR